MGAVHVFGSINRDLVAFVDALPRPGETVIATSFARFPGGKGANQAVAARRLGARTTMTGSVGDDRDGDELLAFLSSEGVDVSGVGRQTGVPTGTAFVTVGGGQNAIVAVPGANAVWDDPLPLERIAPGDVVLTQFEIPAEVVAAVVRAAAAAGAIAILNPAPARAVEAALLRDVGVMVLNELELAALAGTPLDAADPRALERAARSLRARGPRTVVATLGPAGALVCTADECRMAPAPRVEPADTTGAGDCFIGALAASLAGGEDMAAAVGLANRAAALSVTRRGAAASFPRREELWR